jgi:hypothetical protein
VTDKPICGKCGKIHVTWQGAPSCIAHKKGTDPLEPCTKNKIKKTDMCRSHGGAAGPQGKQVERIALMEAQGEIAQLMREVDVPEQHPIDGLLEVVRVSGAMMRLLTIKVGELSEEPESVTIMVETKKGDLLEKDVAGNDALWGHNKDGEMVPHIWVTLLRTWTERYERACKTALDAGIEERRIRLAEDTADTFFAALTKTTATLGLSPEQTEKLWQGLARELRTSVDVIELI